MGKMSRSKGARGEREIVHLFTDAGFPAKRTAPLQTFKQNDMPDVLADINGVETTIEVKLRASGYKTIYDQIEGNDLLVLRMNGERWIVCQDLTSYLEGKQNENDVQQRNSKDRSHRVWASKESPLKSNQS